jgi:triacylglycerol lipase
MDRSIPGTIWIALCGLFQLILCGSVRGSAGVSADSGSSAPVRPSAARRVVLVHGIYNSGRYMGNMQRLLESRGWTVYAVSLRPNDASISFEAMAGQLDAFVQKNIPGDAKFDLVGFSMGGLVCRYYIQRMRGYARVRRFVTLSTPNHGTIWAWLSGRAGVKEMRPGSALLRELNADPSKLAPLRYTSIYTPVDLTIVPPDSSRMSVARNVVSWVPFHALMVWMPGPLRVVEQALE